MTEHKLNIDNVNLTNTYGVRLKEGTVAKWLEIPPFKGYPSANWHERDGINVISSYQPKFRSKEFTLGLHVPESGYSRLMSALLGRGYHKIRITDTPITLEKCRMVGVTRRTVSSNGLVSVDVKIASDDDFRYILENGDGAGYYTPAAVGTDITFTSDEADEYKLSGLGAILLEGARDAIIPVPTVKQPMLRDVSVMDGHIADEYSTGTNTVEYGVSSFDILMTGNTPYDMWGSYMYIMYQLTRLDSTHLTMTHGAISAEGDFCYDGMSVTEYIPSTPVPWLKFRLKMKRL